MRFNSQNLVGQKFGRLSVIAKLSERVNTNVMWECVCDCGNTNAVSTGKLRSGHTRSCGCLAQNRITTEDFIHKAREVHGNKYDYSKTVYVKSYQALIIVCPSHGEFKQTPASHLSGSGCRECGKERISKKKSSTKAEFVEKARNKFGDRFSYPSEYVTSSTPMVIICREHGEFIQEPGLHLQTNNGGCKKCDGRIYSAEDFTNKAVEIHGNRYDYSLVEYLGSKKKVKIVCNIHGIFTQTPHNHTAGAHGCPTCGECGFDKSLPANLYLLKYKNIIKVGITNRDVKARIIQINSSSKCKFELVACKHFVRGEDALKEEKTLLGCLRKTYKSPSTKFDGSSECFVDVDKSEIDNILRGLLE